MKRTIGIDINKHYISFAQLCCKRGEYYLEKSYVYPIPESASSNQVDTEEIQAVIKDTIVNVKFDSKALAIISMPYGKVFFHNYKTAFSSDKDLDRLLKYELEDDFPIAFDDLVINILSENAISENQKEFLVGAVSRSELKKWTQVINETGVDCSVVTSDINALYNAIKLNHGLDGKDCSMIIHVDNSRMIIGICRKDSLLFVRYIDNIKIQQILSSLKQEIALTMKAVSNTEISQPSKIYLSGYNNLVQIIKERLPEDMNSEIILSDPFIKISSTSEQKKNDKLIIALGLALTGLEPQGHEFNFLAADKAESDQLIKTKKNALVFGVLLAAFVILLFINFFAQLKGLENENKDIEHKIREVFIKTLPDEKKIVNELAQMDEKYSQLQKEYDVIASEIVDRVPAIEILKNISENITPGQNIAIAGISMTPETVLLNGTAADFESVDNLVEKLKQIKEFDSVEIQNVDLDPKSNKVRFSLSIKIDKDN